MPLPVCSPSLMHPAAVQLRRKSGAGSIGSVRFTNVASTSCVLDGVRVSGTLFRITDGGVGQVELAPGEAHDVWITGPDGGTPLTSTLLFHVLGPDSTEEQIPLWAP